MKADELREMYLSFYEGKGHKVCPSDVLVPTWDNSVLFTPAGMNQFKDHFLGKVKLEFTRATSCQKCLRTGDIDNVGRTPYHHTFFEMLGNFSFGDYFKREAIEWAWEFLTSKKWLAIDPTRLTVTVFLDDDEASDIWHKHIGLSLDRIHRMDENDNFWPAGAPSQGPDGVCGPCSEIFYHPPGGGKEVEIWNLVFTQFNRMGNPPNNLHPLPSNNIDTGMGLERTAAQLQGVETNFHIDILKPIVNAAADVCGVHYELNSDNGRRLRRITDHVRACTFAIHENVYPGAAKEEYVVRRLLRRAVLDGQQMGMTGPFLYQLVPAVVAAMKHPYPDLTQTAVRVAQVIQREEQSFFERLDAGLARIEKTFEQLRSRNANTIPGQEAAEMYQTYGFPPELFEAIARERGCDFDWPGYRTSMEKHSEMSGKIADTVMGDSGPIDPIKRRVKHTAFLGYNTLSSPAKIQGLVDGDSEVEQLTVGSSENANTVQVIVLDQSPFYAESGGQVGDTGTITGPKGTFQVTNTQKNGDVILHWGAMQVGQINGGDQVTAAVNVQRRQAIRRAHSATHILHHALQHHLGSHAQQRGSKVADDWLRFDFSNLEPVSPEKLHDIEKLSNTQVQSAASIKAEILPLTEARARGAMMLFGEKYPDPVRMISMGEFSKELCGGTHLDNTAEVQAFEIISEEGVSSGTRRIEALTGAKALENQQRVRAEIAKIQGLVPAHPHGFIEGVKELAREVKEIRKAISSGKSWTAAETHLKSKPSPSATSADNDYFTVRNQLRDLARALNVPILDVANRVQLLLQERETMLRESSQQQQQQLISADELIALAETISGIQVIVQQLPHGNPAAIRGLIDEVRSKCKPVAIFLGLATDVDKVQLVAGLSAELIQKGLNAGQWIKEIAPLVGGGGGGKPDFAQAGGKQPEKLKAAVLAAREYIVSQLQR